ncbi:uncharacterized protein H6S33_008430 [Morchella sextelata]|uniref:uncharacterized protein n=1 Tax=Morchella sextelata TaxID=1174677 RepID=UPI001D03C718|nr:uncharacterized protein H6S33_008430 [Morchella sextelata]KAH0602780.1 hypothetical protein H6S33_008430 [Morchella sextelata]
MIHISQRWECVCSTLDAYMHSRKLVRAVIMPRLHYRRARRKAAPTLTPIPLASESASLVPPRAATLKPPTEKTWSLLYLTTYLHHQINTYHY